MEKRIIQFFLLILGVIFIWNVWNPLWRYDLNKSVDSSSEEKIVFEIEKGSAAKTIGKNLASYNLIVSSSSFIRTLEDEDLDGSLRYGRFVLSPSMTLREIITVLTTEGTGELAVTLIEGWTIDEMDAELYALGLINEGDFKLCTFNCEFDYDFLGNDRSLEGFLFPDTYFIDSETFSPESFINQMLTNFDNKFDEQMQADLEASGRTMRETITVASMIEKEVQTKDDIPLVGGIIWKRLDNNWTLGIDATLLYIDDDGEISSEDLASESPYNTRINTGLPPTAISNPGLKSIMGALYPTDSEYWFYLNTLDTGEVIYAVSNEEHEQNKAQYLQ